MTLRTGIALRALRTSGSGWASSAGGARRAADNSRYVFYLAQSYGDSGQLKNSLKSYERRAAMGGWAEEVWYSLFEVGKLSERLGLPPATVMERYLAAYQFRPLRAEPLVELARFFRERKQYALAHLFAQRAIGKAPKSVGGGLPLSLVPGSKGVAEAGESQ